MFKSALLYSFLFCLAGHSGQAQTTLGNNDTLLIGTWKGNSICQIKNSACHDETVVYRITKNKGVDTFYIDASKIVNGEEVDMGIIPFIYNKKTNQLIATVNSSIWTFNMETGKLDGTLIVHGDLYRKIKLYKQY